MGVIRIYRLIGTYTVLAIVAVHLVTLLDAPLQWLNQTSASLDVQCNRWGLVLQLLAGLSVVPGLFDSTKAKSFFEALARSLREVTIEAWLRRDSHMPSRVELFLMLSWFLAFLDFGWYLWNQSISEVWAKCMILMCALAFAAFVPYGLATITEGIARILGWLTDANRNFTRILGRVTFPLFMIGGILQLAATFVK